MFRILPLLLLLVSSVVHAAEPRARDLGVPFDGTPGPLNAITDVAGVTVGQVTLVEDLSDGRKVRTGVTAILPLGRATITSSVFAGWFALNGAGEMTGTTWVEESGQLEGPVLLTNTHSVGAVHACSDRVARARGCGRRERLLVVDASGGRDLGRPPERHQRLSRAGRARRPRTRRRSIRRRRGGKRRRRHRHDLSRVQVRDRHFVATGRGLRFAVHTGRAGAGQLPACATACSSRASRSAATCAPIASTPSPEPGQAAETGSIIIVVATDAPLLPHQLTRLARRASLGLARMGSSAGNGSGDIFLAFSTANRAPLGGSAVSQATYLVNDRMDALFVATVQATEEAITNALVAARDMQGTEGHYARAIDHDALVDLLRRYGRLPDRR